MKTNEFREHAHRMVDWMADYLENVEQYPVKSPAAPGDILAQLPAAAPTDPEAFEDVMRDFERIIIPGITHWQHPSFMAYFPANSSPPSLLGEMLTATLGAQCMSWQTSPAATELEERVMDWLRDMLGLPETFTGVIQDTASTATLCSLLTAREKASAYATNREGLRESPQYVVYCSRETHSSVDKAVRIAGLGSDNIRKIDVDDNLAMVPSSLVTAIKSDIEEGRCPLWVVATLGTTSSTAIDPLRAIGEICRQHDLWLHVDAAFAGTALVLPEMRWIADGIELADTFVFNPHKWMFTNFDCSAYFVKDAKALVRTFEIFPEYLKTAEAETVRNYRDWGIQLGRRFRALKLWFVIRTFGVKGIQERLREQLKLAKRAVAWIEEADDFEILAPVPLNLICFRYHPDSIDDPDQLDTLNQRLLEELNASGKIYLTHTKLRGTYCLRLSIAQTEVSIEHVERAWELIQETARGL
jgi:aromatic-L-amino-acid decarboxylase